MLRRETHRPDGVVPWDELVASHLDGPRLEHSRRTAAFAADLARRFGLDPSAAYRAALLHDIDKGVPAAQLLDRVRRLGLTGELVEPPWPEILHGPVAAAELMALGLDPEEAAAIAEHTTGRAGMGPLSMVVYVADKIEPGRDYEGVEALRRDVGPDLVGTMRRVMTDQVAHMLRRGAPVHPTSLGTWNWLSTKGEDGAGR